MYKPTVKNRAEMQHFLGDYRSFHDNPRIMFKNYLKTALRQLRKQKFYSAIKIGGFALGIAACRRSEGPDQ